MCLSFEIAPLGRELRLNEVGRAVLEFNTEGKEEAHVRKGHMKTQREDSHLHTKGRGLWKNQTCWHLDLGIPALK